MSFELVKQRRELLWLRIDNHFAIVGKTRGDSFYEGSLVVGQFANVRGGFS